MASRIKRVVRVLLPVTILVICGLIAVTITSMKQQPKKKDEAALAPLVKTIAVKLETTTLKLTSYGVVKPKHQTSLIAEVSGRVINLSPIFVSGGIVKKDQLLAQIDPSDYEAALLDAQANLSRAKAALLEEQARGKVAAKEWQGASSKLPPELGLRKPQLAREQASVRSAQAALSRAQRNLERTNITAPYDALINNRQTDLSQFVTVGSVLGVVSSINTAEVRLPISNSDYAYLDHQIKNANVLLSRTENGQTISWQAKLIRDEGVIDQSSRMVYLVAEITEPYQRQPKLKFGSFVDATIDGVKLQNIAKLPSYLYQEGFVTVLSDDRKLTQRPVKLFKRNKQFVFIKQGLQDGELVVVTKLEHLHDGMTVRLKGDKAPKKSVSTSDKVASLGE